MKPFAQPEDPSSETLADILREAEAGLRITPPPTTAPAPSDDAAVTPTRSRPPLQIRYEVDTRRLDTSDSIRVRITPERVIAMVLGLVTVAAWASIIVDWSAARTTSFDGAYMNASARWAVAITSRRIETFQREFHHTPNTLEEIGRPISDLIGYERISQDRYRVRIPTANGTLAYDSIQPLQDFLGQSGETLGLSTRGSRP